MTQPIPFFDTELDSILDNYELSDIAKNVIKSRVVTNFLLKLTEIFEQYESQINTAFRDQKVDLQNEQTWKELMEKVPQIQEEVKKYMETDFVDLVAECISTVKVSHE